MAGDGEDKRQPPSGNVLSFHPESGRHRGRKTRCGNSSATGSADGRTEPFPADAGHSLHERIENLARIGLSEKEIRQILGDRIVDGGLDGLEVSELVRQGRARGRAEIKYAQFAAALEGKVTAQEQVLFRLDDDAGVSGEVEVERRIIGEDPE